MCTVPFVRLVQGAQPATIIVKWELSLGSNDETFQITNILCLHSIFRYEVLSFVQKPSETYGLDLIQLAIRFQNYELLLKMMNKLGDKLDLSKYNGKSANLMPFFHEIITFEPKHIYLLSHMKTKILQKKLEKYFMLKTKRLQ
ncbi:UNKNOWN [Stylonychia lemnae]|uniref:Uncharacterized protein n=1 Tax=Stylonychia lemnae TaxID=5949 RepID=A0A078AYF1_STYLE|nr:UNKNOWN [Stylonychia lemnae]|eukprot:CDW87161.1 UNKNOWN [Stylonychia lemnae]